jgi:hypothetical protein
MELQRMIGTVGEVTTAWDEVSPVVAALAWAAGLTTKEIRTRLSQAPVAVAQAEVRTLAVLRGFRLAGFDPVVAS